uniref:Uncharacterized protein n=2 Tax=Babesia bovis TaxID=5865 RepID=A7ATW5_BABBO|eukprot:XP_001609944.1 hypothetical protein [Babesia bovis T2Bo]
MKSHSLSQVTGNHHGTTWAMAEKVTQGDDPEEVVVVEGTTSDEVAKNKESPKGLRESCEEWCNKWDILDKDGKLKWDMNPYVVVLLVAFGFLTGLGPVLIVVIIIVYVILSIGNKIINPKTWLGSSGNNLKNVSVKNVD